MKRLPLNNRERIINMRTEKQCQEARCEGCVVCDRKKFTLEDLEHYRKLEAEIDEIFKKTKPSYSTTRPLK